jgi:hypothetical protein
VLQRSGGCFPRPALAGPAGQALLRNVLSGAAAAQALARRNEVLRAHASLIAKARHRSGAGARFQDPLEPHQVLAVGQLDLAGVGKTASEKLGDEGDPGANRDLFLRRPLRGRAGLPRGDALPHRRRASRQGQIPARISAHFASSSSSSINPSWCRSASVSSRATCSELSASGATRVA